jgi:hypothetical protein
MADRMLPYDKRELTKNVNVQKPATTFQTVELACCDKYPECVALASKDNIRSATEQSRRRFVPQ